MSFTRVEQNGVEFYTLESTGESGMSLVGLARLCRVSDKAIAEILRNSARGLTRSKRLEPLQNMEIDLEVIGPRGAKIIRAEACASIIGYYAFESRSRTAEAQYAFERFAIMGIESWIQGITGWRNSQEASAPEIPDVPIPHSAIVTLNQSRQITKTAYRLYLEIQTHHSQNLRPSIADLCQTLSITRPTYHKALKILDQLELLPDWAIAESRRQPERFVRNWLWQQLGGQIEAPSPDGPIDLLTPEEVIEVKAVQNWKEAIGHVLCKAKNYPDRHKCLLLFGEVGSDVAQITQRCEEFGIQMGFIEIEYCHDPETDNITVQLVEV